MVRKSKAKGGRIQDPGKGEIKQPIDTALTPAGADVQPLSTPGEPPEPGPPPGPPIGAGQMGALTAPTNRPNEPIISGLPREGVSGSVQAGRGIPQTGPDLTAAVRAMYRIYPHPALLELMN